MMAAEQLRSGREPAGDADPKPQWVGVMGRAIAILSGSAAVGRPFSVIAEAVGRFWRDLTRDAVRPYRPEQHYMRGPGPAWRAKHGQQ
jgi:hypothetical protein